MVNREGVGKPAFVVRRVRGAGSRPVLSGEDSLPWPQPVQVVHLLDCHGPHKVAPPTPTSTLHQPNRKSIHLPNLIHHEAEELRSILLGARATPQVVRDVFREVARQRVQFL